MKRITKHLDCPNNADHCKHCRDLSDGRQWRRELLLSLGEGEVHVDFACPFNIPWSKGSGVATSETIVPLMVIRKQPQPKQTAFQKAKHLAKRVAGLVNDDIAAEEAQRKQAEQQAAEMPGAWERLGKGAVGLTKVALGIDRATADLIAERKAKCEACEFLKDNTCQKCGCWYSQKVKLAAERCPVDKW